MNNKSINSWSQFLQVVVRYIKYNSLKLTFLKTRTRFFSRLRNRGFKKVWLRKTFSVLQYEDRPKLMKNSHCLIAEFQVVPETEVENLMVRDSERILKEWETEVEFQPEFHRWGEFRESSWNRNTRSARSSNPRWRYDI